MSGEVAVQLIRHVLAAHARFGVQKTVKEGKRSCQTKVAQIEAIDDHTLTIMEVPDPTHAGARRYEVFLSPNADEGDGEAEKAEIKVVADFRLFAISVRFDHKPVTTDLLFRQDVMPDSWLAPVARSLHLALAPVIAEIVR